MFKGSAPISSVTQSWETLRSFGRLTGVLTLYDTMETNGVGLRVTFPRVGRDNDSDPSINQT